MKASRGSVREHLVGRADAVPARGFTLIELLIVIAIVSLVSGVLAMIVYQLLTVPRWANNQLAVDSDRRNAGLWLRRDGNESGTFIGLGCPSCPDDGPPCFLFDTGPERGTVYTYTLSGETLQRSDGGQIVDVARHVESVTCPSGPVTGTLAITLVARSGEVSTSQTYSITPRLE